MKHRAQGFTWLLLLCAALGSSACVAEGGHCLNPQPDLPCTHASNVSGGSGAVPSSGGTGGGNLNVDVPPANAGSGPVSGGASSGGAAGTQGEAGSVELGEAGDQGQPGEAGAGNGAAGAGATLPIP